jgi:hypothetical protein
MTFPKAGSRSLVVGDRSLRYVVQRRGVRGCPDCDQLHVLLADDSRKGSIVLIHALDGSGPDQPITPRLIAAVAARALDAGWQPGVGTGVFHCFSLRPDGTIR